tara:strand:+ start:3642 stop:4550 length:909 start_codon:yes stop_codon:yes gene_type:complete
MTKSTKPQQEIIDSQKPSKFVIKVRLRDQMKTELFDPSNIISRVGDNLMVETQDGPKLGVVASNKVLNIRKDCAEAYPKVLRKAQPSDFEETILREELEQQAKQICLEQIKRLDLPMNLSRVSHQKKNHKITFYFTADGRIDFRELVRVLAHNLKSRIEMRQVGVRDEAKVINGYGICGQTLCCSTFLKEFTPVTIRMAKDQGLALNPSKISGVCGRLMCCLQYEHGIYKELVKTFPRIGNRLKTPEGWGKIMKNNILEKAVTVLLDDESYMTYHLDEIKSFDQSELSQDQISKNDPDSGNS